MLMQVMKSLIFNFFSSMHPYGKEVLCRLTAGCGVMSAQATASQLTDRQADRQTGSSGGGGSVFSKDRL